MFPLERNRRKRQSSMPDKEAPAAASSGLKQTVERSLAGEPLTRGAVLDALGGVRGIFESFLPGFVFICTFAFTQNLWVSVIAPAAAGVVALLARLIQRERTVPALVGLGGILVCSLTTLLTGSAEDYFLPGLITNIAWLVGLVVSVIIRWPLLGFVLGLASGSLTSWREDAKMRGAAYLATYVWLAMFVLRLAVQVPLYLADQVTWLGVARITMGVPLFGLVIIFTWLIIRAFVPKPAESGVAT